MREVIVAAAALIAPDNRVLVARRPPGKSFAGQWEFPGGKLELGETPEAALHRELHEELGILVAPADLEPLTTVCHVYPDFKLVMIVYACRFWAGTLHGCEGQALLWADAATLATLPMPPADLPVVTALAALLPN